MCKVYSNSSSITTEMINYTATFKTDCLTIKNFLLLYLLNLPSFDLNLTNAIMLVGAFCRLSLSFDNLYYSQVVPLSLQQEGKKVLWSKKSSRVPVGLIFVVNGRRERRFITVRGPLPNIRLHHVCRNFPLSHGSRRKDNRPYVCITDVTIVSKI